MSSSSDEDEDYIPESLVEEEDNIELSDEVNEVLEKFYDYLTGPDRCRKARSVRTVADDIARALKAIGAHQNLALIFDKNTNFLRNNYVNNH